ncbi:DNA polymerase iota/DNA damage inducible protein [Ceraceosorus bombacis]|uniref:DNA polymerase iota/DNA damage inducible protein n=1 Tax=Ceraceosorus bombacis TaxID=401625 RepID=A0A0P1B9Q1_9BASI|nr:DNA polymerase iota/DNA damage inducible protein [Ceraceosorus bombacis]
MELMLPEHLPLDGGGTVARCSTSAPRIIIHVDLDAFYVGASRLRDPTLRGLPVGIKQKHILATVSYEARALGAKKLGKVMDSLRACPSMILVDGEDLTWFRMVSRRVFGLMSEVCGPATPIEKLGMDELWLDVTQLIDGHLSSLPQADESGKRWFPLPSGSSTPSRRAGDSASCQGFLYGMHAVGHISKFSTFEASGAHPTASMRFVVATHLAKHLLAMLDSALGLSASAGVSTSKLLSKIVGGENKPAQQTLFAPLGGTLQQQAGIKATFVEAREIRALAGFGSVVANRIEEFVRGLPHNQSRSESKTHHSQWHSVPPHAPETNIEAEATAQSSTRLSVAEVRSQITLSDMCKLFGKVQGARLWPLLWGQDPSPVGPAPLFPATISIEDTFSPRGATQNAVECLVRSLLRRLENELRAGSTGFDPNSKGRAIAEVGLDHLKFRRVDRQAWSDSDYSNAPNPIVRYYELIEQDEAQDEARSSALGPWLRFPATLRVGIVTPASIADGTPVWKARNSKSSAMPVEIFEVEHCFESRANALSKAVQSLEKALNPQRLPIRLLNLAAADLRERQPDRRLDSWLTSRRAGKTPVEHGVDLACLSQSEASSIDLDIFSALPDDIQRELAAQHGLDLQQLQAKRSDTHSSTHALPSGASLRHDDEQLQRDVQDRSGSAHCEVCRAACLPFLLHDHETWQVSGLPEELRQMELEELARVDEVFHVAPERTFSTTPSYESPVVRKGFARTPSPSRKPNG